MKRLVSLLLTSLMLTLIVLGSQRTTATPPAQQGTPAATAPADPSGLPGTGRIKGVLESEARTLTGRGANFPQSLYAQWAVDYEKITGVKISYNGTNTSDGIEAINAQQVDLAGTDAPMTDAQIRQARGGTVLHVATAVAGAAIVYNVPEATEPLKFTPETLALIFLADMGAESSGGRETVAPLLNWNDPRLVKDNPQLKDVNRRIFPIYRTDSSGTTYIFSSYLSAVNEKWKRDVGAGTTLKWPVGLGERASQGVASLVRQAPYTISYLEYSFAEQSKLQVGTVRNKAGKFVSATSETLGAALNNTRLPDDFRVNITNGDGENTYPIAGLTWLLVYERQTEPAKAIALTRFLWWATHDGQATNTKLGYGTLTPAAVRLAERQIQKITVRGRPALPAGIASGQ